MQVDWLLANLFLMLFRFFLFWGVKIIVSFFYKTTFFVIIYIFSIRWSFFSILSQCFGISFSWLGKIRQKNIGLHSFEFAVLLVLLLHIQKKWGRGGGKMLAWSRHRRRYSIGQGEQKKSKSLQDWQGEKNILRIKQ